MVNNKLTLGMPELLEFVHASPESNQIPSSVRRCLDAGWNVKRSRLDSVSTWKTLPAFTWLDLGRVSNPISYAQYWSTLAGLQEKSGPISHIFISGVAPSTELHDRVLQDVFRTLNPLSVEVDLAGNPDVVAALAKFQAVRREPSASNLLKAFRKMKTHRTETIRREVPNADLRLESGNLSAKSMAELFGVTLTELGEWIGRKKAALSKTPDSKGIQPLLEPLARIAFYRKALGDDASFRKWLRTEHELLEQKSPMHWIKSGRTREIAEFVEDALTGQPT